MFLTDTWETISDISAREGLRADIVVNVVVNEYREGRAEIRVQQLLDGSKKTLIRASTGHEFEPEAEEEQFQPGIEFGL